MLSDNILKSLPSGIFSTLGKLEWLYVLTRLGNKKYPFKKEESTKLYFMLQDKTVQFK